MIDPITHAFENFQIVDIVLKDTPIAERPRPQPILLVEFVDTTCEQPIDNLTIEIKHVVLGD
jgi:hypothetical protein